ncbi:hypothetical protein L6164_010077 [Bauhinia variegata]|uniref:Uncharacterized protein n=1 Tax=Bauhinia variegata TaxID=167791 RepID=A0ACB9PNF3_BAUVA|nr:hypothetical protein L6164_010077 [Bauhinia variegata]
MFSIKINPSANNRNMRSQHAVVSTTSTTKKLWKLPHVFAKVLELPFRSDDDVSVEETPHSFRFIAYANNINISNGVRAHAIEILPGMTKIVIKGMDGADLQQSQFQPLDLWRFRLPAWTRPEMTTAVYSAGKLVVTVPKSLDYSGK